MRRWFAIAVTAVTVAGGMLALGATPASADQTWHQSFQRASADAACTSPVGATAWQEGWLPSDMDWRQSWEQWANNGQGGWTCNRSITWAHDVPVPNYPVGGCRLIPPYFVQFGAGYAAPIGSRGYLDSGCTTPAGDAALIVNVIYAPVPYIPSDLCQSAFGTSQAWPAATDVFGCGPTL